MPYLNVGRDGDDARVVVSGNMSSKMRSPQQLQEDNVEHEQGSEQHQHDMSAEIVTTPTATTMNNNSNTNSSNQKDNNSSNINDNRDHRDNHYQNSSTPLNSSLSSNNSDPVDDSDPASSSLSIEAITTTSSISSTSHNRPIIPKNQHHNSSSSNHDQPTLEQSHQPEGATVDSGSNRLVRTGEHTYRIPDGEKCTVKVGDKIRIIHGPAILNFASSDGLMTSVMGDVPKISASSDNIPKTTYEKLPSLGSSPSKSDHGEDEDSSFADYGDSSDKREATERRSSDVAERSLDEPHGGMGDFSNPWKRAKPKNLFPREPDNRDQHNQTNSEEEVLFDDSGNFEKSCISESPNEESSNGGISAGSSRGKELGILHVDISTAETNESHRHHCSNSSRDFATTCKADLVGRVSSTSPHIHQQKLGGSRHASPGSEKSQDSSYSSGSFDCKSPPAQSSPTSVQTASTDHHNHGVVTSPNALSSSDTNCVNIGTVSNTVLAPSASSNASRRTKRKVKLVPYQDTTAPEYVEKVKNALNSVGMPRVLEVEATGAKVIWDSCRPTAFPQPHHQSSASSSSSSLVDRVCYVLCWSEAPPATPPTSSNGNNSSMESPKTQVTCGSLCKYLMESLIPSRTYEVCVYATLDDIKGMQSAVVPFTTKGLPPDRPSPPVLKSASRNSLLVSWQPPNNDNGAKVTAYKLFAVEESKNLDLSSVDIISVTMGANSKGSKQNFNGKSNNLVVDERLKYEGCQRSAKVDHLVPNTEYRLRLVACNIHGASLPSSEVILRTLPLQPPQPDPPNLVYRDTHVIRLSWSSYLAKHLKALSRQHLDFTLQMEDQQNPKHGFITQYFGPDSCFTLTNLPRSSKFAFKLFAETSHSRSVSSEAVVFSTLNSVPRPPTGLKCTDVTSNRCTLRWDAFEEDQPEKPGDDGGSEVVEYIVERSISGGLFQEIYHGDDVSLPISSLFPGMQYHFRVAAVNSVGKGKFSVSCQCITLPVVPTQCAAPAVSGRVKPQSVQLTWSPPDYDGGSPIEEYAVKQITNLDSSEESGDEISRDYRCDLIVFELQPGTVYGFSVCAINSVGPGPWSPPLKIRTASDKPSPPDAPRVVFKSATHAKISWSVPKCSNGSKVVEYKLECCEIRRPNPFVKFDVCNAIVGSKLVDDEGASHHDLLSSAACYYGSRPLSTSSVVSGGGVATSTGTSSHSSSKRSLNSTSSIKSGGDASYSNSQPTSRYGSNFATYNSSSGSSSQASAAGDKPRAGRGAPQKSSTATNKMSSCNSTQTVSFFQLYTGAKLSFDYNNMKPATDYVFRVQAVNEIGPSQFSAETAISSPCSNPERVGNISVDQGAEWISLKWSEPECNGAAILSYNIECARLHRCAIPVVIGVNSSLEFPDEKNAHIVSYICEDNAFTISNIKSDNDYMVRVQATNENGNGAFSSPVRAHTLSLPPEPPQLECVNATSSSLKLRWTELSCSKDLKYHLQMEDKSSRFVTTYSGAAVSYKVIKLQELTSYTFRINASNDAGSGTFSPLYSFTTTKSAPPPMKAPKMRICRDTGCAEISWTPVPGYQEDKVLYQLMVAFAPASGDFLQVYKGEETFVDVEQIVMLATSRFNSVGLDVDNNVLDMKLKVCAMRLCLDDDQLISGQYSPISSFLYSLESHNSAASSSSVSSTGGLCGRGRSGRATSAASGNRSYALIGSYSSGSFSASSSSISASYWSGNANCQLSSSASGGAIGGGSGSSHNQGRNVSSCGANWIELDQSESCIANAVATLQNKPGGDKSGVSSYLSSSSSKDGSSPVSYSVVTSLCSNLRSMKKAVTDYQPSDRQIAGMFLTAFVVLLAVLAIYVQQWFA
ncbi:uncharacterized protein LOC142340547 isoform X3 [Convolutriloba macropyga]|uniref:uncharacterized protein LOC142340547 isoform X3 n=1 Tax=Convolutriloba macropyga TaxID=536237 RepID=UPI003F524FB6